MKKKIIFATKNGYQKKIEFGHISKLFGHSIFRKKMQSLRQQMPESINPQSPLIFWRGARVFPL